jgi:WD40 repeat protein
VSDVFISYSRQEQAFADKLAQELEKNNRSVWIDRVRIELTSDWWEEIKRGIEASDNFVLIMSPSSMASPVCHLEIEYALQLTKRIIPLYHLDHSKSDTKTRFGDRLDSDDFLLTLYGDRNPMALFEENWSVIPAINRVEAQVTATQGDDDGLPMRFDEQEFSAFFTHLRQAIDTDIAHVHQHTRLLTRTRDWRLADEKASFLLNPVETDEAEGWLQDWEADRDARAERNLPPKNPQPDEQMRRFIATSRIVVDQELRRQRNLQRATVIFAIVGVLSIVAVIGSLVNLNATQQQASTAQAQADDAQVRADNAQDQVATANNALTQVPPTLTEVGAQVLSARNQADQANAELTSIPPTLTQVNEQVVTAEGQIQVASTQVAQANDELNAVLPTLTQVNQTVQDSLLQIDALGLVGLGQQQIQAGNTRTAAWLALRSFALLPTSQGRDLLAEVDQRPLPITESFMGDMVDINADGTLAVGAWFDEGRQIRLYQLPDMTQIASLVDDSEASIGALAISPDGQYVAVSGDDGEAPETWLVTVFDASSGELLYRTEAFDAPVVALAFSPDNRRLALGLRDPDTEGNEAVIEWDVAENEEIRRYQGVYHSALSLAYSPDGAWLAVGEVYGTVAIFDMATGERIQRLNVQFYGLLSSTQTRVVRFSDDSQRLAVSAGTIFLSAGEDWVVKVYDTRTWEDIVTIPTFNVLTNDLDFSQDNRLLLGAQNNGWVNIWNAGTGELLSRLDAHNGNRFIAVNSDIVNTAFLFDDELVLSVDARGNRSYIWQMRSTQELEDTAGETQYIDFDPNGRLLLSSDGLPRARIINPLTRQREGSFPVYKGALFT